MRAASLFLAVLAVLAFGCADTTGPGGRCIADADCEGSLGCYSLEATSSRRCLARCDPSAVVLCSEELEGSVGLCAAIEGARTPGVCLVGGEALPGAGCGSSVQCAEPGVCVLTGSAGVCERACDVEAPACGAGEVCRALEGRRGYCAAAVDGGA